MALGCIDWAGLAESFGAPAFVAANDAELASAVDQALLVQGPSVIEARIDRSNYAATLRVVRG